MKLAISAAILHGPELLFLDEPFEGIDAVSSRLIKNILGSLLEKQVTIFLTSHILEIVEKLCAEVGIIHRGALVARGSVEELRRGRSADGAEATLEELFLGLVEDGGAPRKGLSWLE